ncbi:family 16 glycoside hydrolase [Streptosporangium lutulentum]
MVLSEDFSSGKLPEGWTGHLGTWQVKDGRLEGTSVNGQRARITFGTSYENYRFEAEANFLQVADESRWLNLAADFHGAEDYGSVFVVRSNTKLRNGLEYAVKKTAAGAYTSPTVAAAGAALNTGETHALSLEVRGTRAVLSVDGVESLSTNDLFRTDGTLGLVINNATVAFDDIKVTRLAPEATAPGAPTGLRVSQKDTQATLAWSAPADAGETSGGEAATVTGYEVAIGAAGAGADGLTWSPEAGTSHTFTNLAPGAYTMWVRALNDAGKTGEPARANASPGVPTIKGFARTLNGGAWSTSHVQGIAVDQAKGYIYYSFTTLLVKTDLQGNIVGTLGGFTGHLGDLDVNKADGRVYGSLEYKAQKAFYIAIIDVDAIDRVGMQAQNSDVMRTVYLNEVVADFTADMDGNGVFDGDTANTPTTATAAAVSTVSASDRSSAGPAARSI